MNNIDQFLKTIADIRHPEQGCVWNLKQSHASLKRYLLEELYESLEAIDLVDENPSKENYKELKEELGDLLLQIVLHSRIAEEKGFFNFNDVVEQINDKMIKRHPHVFKRNETGEVKTTAEVDKHWDREKAKEKDSRQSIFEGIPREMPALARAWKISKKAVAESFEWDEEYKLWDQLDSEVDELKEVIETYRKATSKDPYRDGYDDAKVQNDAELELGDILFTVVNIARWYKIDPEEALRKVNNKFISRFNIMTDICKKQGKKLKDYSISELERLWQQAKLAHAAQHNQ